MILKIFPNYLERLERNELNVTLNSLERSQYFASNTHAHTHRQTCTDVLTFEKKQTQKSANLKRRDDFAVAKEAEKCHFAPAVLLSPSPGSCSCVVLSPHPDGGSITPVIWR